MRFKKAKFKDVIIIEDDHFTDERGYLDKLFDHKELVKNGIVFNLTQIKFVFSKTCGTIRGLHMQTKPYEEAKIVRCVRGKIFDVVLDVREFSENYGKWFGIELEENDKKSLYIPEGFAHGYQSLMDNSEVLYLMSGEFSLPHNTGFLWNDSYFDITWPIKPTKIANRDRKWPLFERKYG